MIAVCPTCHDAVHRGELKITDDELYRWKQFSRSASPPAHLYVEPSPEAPLLILGSIAVRGDPGLVVFDFARRHRLSFSVVQDEIMHVNATVYGLDGGLLVEVIDGYVLRRQPDIKVVQHPGRIALSVSGARPILSTWAEGVLANDDSASEEIALLELHVVEPGAVKVRGVWLDADRGVVVTDHALSFLHLGRPRPLSIVGSGKSSVLHYKGPVRQALFGV